jgi:hypothetical protein
LCGWRLSHIATAPPTPGRFKEYEGREGLKKLAEEVKARGRKLFAKQNSRK